MIIRQKNEAGEETTLVTGSTTKVVGGDEWSVAIEATGTTPQGNRVAFLIGMSHNELAGIVIAALKRPGV